MTITLSSVTESNILAIHDAVYDIALNHSGITWGGQKQWDMPLSAELDTETYPYLAVVWPKFAAYLAGGVAQGQEMRRTPGEIEQAWDIDVFAIYPFLPEDANTYKSALDSLVKLEAAFTKYVDLSGTCEEGNVVNPQPSVPLLFTPGGKYWSSKLTVRAYEVLPTTL
jgi:hypothetical protein